MATLQRVEVDPAVAPRVSGPVLQLAGILDQAGVRAIEREFSAAVNDALAAAASTASPSGGPAAASRPLLIADLTGVSALSTSGISLLLGAHRTLEQNGGRFVLIGTQGYCSDVLRRCRLDSVLQTATDLASALKGGDQTT